jgi:putative cell wall-binding protein
MGAVLLAGLVGSLLAFASPSAALLTEEADTARIDGDDRYETAAAIATDPHWWGDDICSPDVTIVNGEDWPDGLTAGIYGDRVLLVRPDKIPAATEAAIIELMNQSQNENLCDADGEIELKVIGGPAAVSSAVYEQLTLLTNGTGGFVYDEGRIFGADRYETAIAVHDDTSSSSCAILATGTDFPDALAAGVMAHDDDCGILLNQGAALLPAVKAYMIEVGMNDVAIAGGEAAVPASVEAELLSMGINVTRYGGENRDETATLLADDDGSSDKRSVCLVNRDSFADALAAAPFCASNAVDGQIMLVRADSIPPVTAAWHVANCANLGDYTWADINLDADDGTTPDVPINGKVFAIGGTTVISDEVLEDAAAATKCGDEIDLVSATLGLSDIDNQACVVTDEESGWDVLDGPLLVAVPGGAASGIVPTITVVDLSGDGTATDLDPAEAYFDGDELVVDLGEDPQAMTQARFVEIWSSLPEAAATFTAVANSGPLTGPPAADDTADMDLFVTCQTATADVTLTVTFNQPVGAYGDFDMTPDAELWGPSADAATPLLGVADADGNTTFSYFHNDLDTATVVGLLMTGFDIGDTFTLAADAVTNAVGVDNEEITVTITAG